MVVNYIDNNMEILTENLLEITVILLLALTIAFCWRLNIKITELRNSRKDITKLIKNLDSSIVKTYNNIAELKEMSQTSTTELQSYVKQAKELLEDLSYMTEIATKMAQKLEHSIQTSRQQGNEAGRLSQMKEDYNINERSFHHEKEESLHDDSSNIFSDAKKELMEIISRVRGAGSKGGTK